MKDGIPQCCGGQNEWKQTESPEIIVNIDIKCPGTVVILIGSLVAFFHIPVGIMSL